MKKVLAVWMLIVASIIMGPYICGLGTLEQWLIIGKIVALAIWCCIACYFLGAFD